MPGVRFAAGTLDRHAQPVVGSAIEVSSINDGADDHHRLARSMKTFAHPKARTNLITRTSTRTTRWKRYKRILRMRRGGPLMQRVRSPMKWPGLPLKKTNSPLSTVDRSSNYEVAYGACPERWIRETNSVLCAPDERRMTPRHSISANRVRCSRTGHESDMSGCEQPRQGRSRSPTSPWTRSPPGATMRGAEGDGDHPRPMRRGADPRRSMATRVQPH